ncbi:hypothetical protein B0H65DRAFT_341659 [Neurospora tetraspora]|uniref:Transcriptional regulator n=1 Tax=Neurospora tetraspora TaxID=94610 RepID=A0AAE0J1B2_9PEZI|nr:hypothetical protein B0H65DRAFT_341659 [Neurospora tetraspora]
MTRFAGGVTALWLFARRWISDLKAAGLTPGTTRCLTRAGVYGIEETGLFPLEAFASWRLGARKGAVGQSIVKMNCRGNTKGI